MGKGTVEYIFSSKNRNGQTHCLVFSVLWLLKGGRGDEWSRRRN
nr:MAG TPA: hypothetical protein [Caudoviricetes sp.]